MNKTWKDLVLKLLNCFGNQPLSSIKDVKNTQILEALPGPRTSYLRDGSSFEQLLSFLNSFYPDFNYNLHDASHVQWSEEASLYMVSSLLVLYVAVHHHEFFQERASTTLSESDQELIVMFLTKAIHEQNLTSQTLSCSIPNPQGMPSSPSPNLQRKKRKSQGTPLTDFLSSPIARQRRESNVRHQLSFLQDELEREQSEKVDLQLKITALESQLSELGRRFKEKCLEIDNLHGTLQNAEEGQDTLSESQSRFQAENRKLSHDLRESENYIKNLQEEISDLRSAQSLLERKLLASEEKSTEVEGHLESYRKEVCDLREQVLQHSEENVVLKVRCSELERDLNQMQSTTLLSPLRRDVRSAFASPASSPAPESMGFILEKQLIDKENENALLQKKLGDVNEEMKNVKKSLEVLEDMKEKETESALRIQKRLESKIETLQHSLDSTYLELSSSKREKDELRSELFELSRGKDKLTAQLKELTTQKDVLLSEQQTLHDSKNSLEIKVAQMNSKLVIAAEREKDLQELIKKSEQEWNDARQKLDDMEVNILKSTKEKSLLAEQLAETVNKLAVAKSMQLEKNDLEDQLLHWKQQFLELEKKSETVESAKKDLHEKLLTLTEEKRDLESHLEDMSRAKNDLLTSLNEMHVEKNAVVMENVTLLKTKVRLETELAEAMRQVQEVKKEVAKEALEKKHLKNKLADLLASNESLSTQLSISAQQESDVNNKFIEIVKQKKGVESQLAAIVKDKRNLETALEESAAQLAKVSQERENLTCSLRSKTAELELTSSNLQGLLAQKTGLEVQLAAEKADNRDIQDQLSELKQKFELSQLEVSKLKEEIKLLLDECQEKNAAVTDLEAEKSDMEDDLCHYVCSLNTVTQENVSLKTELASLKEEKENLSQENGSLQEMKSQLEQKLSQVQIDLLSASDQNKSLLSELEGITEERKELCLQLKTLEDLVTSQDANLGNLKTVNLSLEQQVSAQLSQIEALQAELKEVCSDLSGRNKVLQDDCDERSQQLSILRGDLSELEERFEKIMQEKMRLSTDLESSGTKNRALEGEVAKTISELEALVRQKEEMKTNFSQKEEQLTSKVKCLEEEIEVCRHKFEETVAKAADGEICHQKQIQEMQKLVVEKEALLSELQQRLELSKSKDESSEEMFTQKIKSVEDAFKEERNALLNQIHELQRLLDVKEVLLSELQKKVEESTIESLKKIKSLEDEVALSNCKGIDCHEKAEEEKEALLNQLQELQRLLDVKEELLSESQKRVEESKSEKEALKDNCTKRIKTLEDEVAFLHQKQREYVDKAAKEKETLCNQIYELQGSIDVKEELLSETQKCVEKLRGEREALQELVKVKDKIITCQNATASSLERQSSDELEVAMKLLEGELHSSQSTSEVITQQLRNIQKDYEEQKLKLEEALQEAQSTARSYQLEAVELKQQLSAPSASRKIVELQQEEKIWQLNRTKIHVEFQFDSMMNQKAELEDHLNQLRDVIKDVTSTCDNLFASLPPNCNAVHEVTVMRKEVETKLRAVDKKYADSLCGIISLADEMFKWTKQQTSLTLSNMDAEIAEASSEKENIELKVIKCCEAMTSLTADVRSVINSCKFLMERCESFLKAQTRESLKIKTCISKEHVDPPNENQSPSNHLGQDQLKAYCDKSPQSTAVDLTSDKDKASGQSVNCWFGDSSNIEEGYKLMRSSYEALEKQVCDLQRQLKELGPSPGQQSNFNQEQKNAKLQDQINMLLLRPTREHLDEKLKELHIQYSRKLDNMKEKMKQIVKEEVDKVEEEKANLEKEIVSKYNKRIAEFEEHVQQLSAQLWKLGEKLLQEQQDHKSTKERLDSLKERQRQYLLSKQRTQSLDRLDMVLQGTHSVRSSTQLKRRCNSQVTQSSLASAKVHPVCDISTDAVDDSSSRRSTMMAPASMGLAFPEEDEDGEIFNNDYLAELKEGKCRVPSDGGRLSELQYRNSLCPPHLKSSYPLETQFHDPQAIKDEDIKGLDARMKRQGKDKGTGKEDVTPKAAALRDHNESQSSAVGMLRAHKTTPSRLRALFTSSKVANAATLPSSKKDESLTPATPTSKRLSIFRRRFGNNKENQNTSRNYSSFR